MQITVVGTHELMLPAERGTVHLVVGFESHDAAQAMQATQQRAAELRAQFERWCEPGGPATWFAVDAVGTRSWRPYHKGAPQRTMHGATVRMRVKFRDFAALGDAAAAWGELEGLRIERMEWTLTEATRRAREDEVLDAAIARARRRAERMAAAIGAGEVRCVQLADPGMLRGVGGQAGPGDSPMLARAFATPGGAEGANGVELSPEDITIATSVHAV